MIAGTLTVSYVMNHVFTFTGSITLPLTGTGEKSLTSHYYAAILKRGYDTGGKDFWDAEWARVASIGADKNETWRAMAQAFYFSAEYALLNRDNTGFATDLYLTCLQPGARLRGTRLLGCQSRAGHAARGGARRLHVLARVPQLHPGAVRQHGSARRARHGDGLLPRTARAAADSGGFAVWVGNFVRPSAKGPTQCWPRSNRFRRLSCRVRVHRTQPHQSQYVGDLYNAFLRRGGDIGGVLFWISALTRTNPVPITGNNCARSSRTALNSRRA
jgi:hypothetical protein